MYGLLGSYQTEGAGYHRLTWCHWQSQATEIKSCFKNLQQDSTGICITITKDWTKQILYQESQSSEICYTPTCRVTGPTCDSFYYSAIKDLNGLPLKLSRTKWSLIKQYLPDRAKQIIIFSLIYAKMFLISIHYKRDHIPAFLISNHNFTAEFFIFY